MSRIPISQTLVLVLAGVMAINPAFAKPPWAEGEKAEKHADKEWKKAKKQHEKLAKEERKPVQTVKVKQFFGDQHRTVVHRYYTEEFSAGRCPPGLAKKNNGCMPPGQAKKWLVGRPLSRNVVYYSVPTVVVTELGPPPVGYRYVRVDDDILLMSIATRMVVDAILGLGG